MPGIDWSQYVVGALGGGMLTGIGSWLFYGQKLKKDRKAGGKKMNADQITRALTEIRNFELQLRTFSGSPGEGQDGKFDWLERRPEIFDSAERFERFIDELGTVIVNNQPYVDLKTNAFLLSMQNLLSVINYVGYSQEVLGTDHQMQVAGVQLKPIFDSWQKAFDAHLVKQLNKTPDKFETMSGRKWEKIRKQVDRTYVKHALDVLAG